MHPFMTAGTGIASSFRKCGSEIEIRAFRNLSPWIDTISIEQHDPLRMMAARFCYSGAIDQILIEETISIQHADEIFERVVVVMQDSL
jgi:hypothetical protein